MSDVAGRWQLLDEATRWAAAVGESHFKAPLLARISVLRQDDTPEFAAQEAKGAVALAAGIEDPYARSFVLSEVSKGLAPTDPANAASAARAALRIAKTVVDLRSRTIALAEAAGALGVVDRERARRALAEAELLADSTCSCRRRCLPAAVLERVAELDPEEALQKADRIPDPALRGIVLSRAIPRLAASDPQRAVGLVERVPELHEQISTWVGLCAELVDAFPELAVRAAENAAGNARFSHNGLVQLNALASVARSVHRVDSALAGELLTAAETVFGQVEPSHSRSLAAAGLARAQARFDADLASKTARQIVHPHPRAHAFVLLAEDVKTSVRQQRPGEL
ncbi:hypothetical protein [Actinospica robiniae]|uniref:hypothetical protein n=1 Tax=Actinospica robiniae TaxID=304901 RepID=UPI00055979C6|nr:hypothetical protein [Actinospica robiniae]